MAKTEYTCPVCGDVWEHDDIFDRHLEKQKSQMEHSCGFRISTIVYKPLCSRCKEWLLYLATENILGDKIRYLKGDDDGEETQEAQEG